MNEEDILREERIRKRLEELRESFIPSDENLIFIYKALADESWRVRKDAISLALVHPVDRIIELLIKGLFSEENAGLRNACQEALTRIGEPIVGKLVDAFKGADSDVRKFILDIIGDIGNSSHAHFLINALDDEDENVIISACENLGKIKNPAAIEPLLKMINPKNEWLSFVILESLSQIRTPFDAKQILPLWQVSRLRKPILDMIYMFDEESQRELLKKSFQDKSFYIQQNAGRAIFSLFNADKQTLSKLQNWLGDIIIYNENYLSLLKGVREDELVFALISFISDDTEFFKNLIEKASDETLEFFGSLSSYGRFKNYKIVPELINQYEGRIQAYLAYLIGLFKIDEGVDYLKNLCKSNYGHTRQAVAFSLGRLVHGFDKSCLFELLDDKYKDVREEAIKSLSKIISKENFPLDLALNIFESKNKDKIISVLSLMERIGYFNEKLIIMALRDINSSVRAKAIKIISTFRLKEFINEVDRNYFKRGMGPNRTGHCPIQGKAWSPHPCFKRDSGYLWVPSPESPTSHCGGP